MLSISALYGLYLAIADYEANFYVFHPPDENKKAKIFLHATSLNMFVIIFSLCCSLAR